MHVQLLLCLAEAHCTAGLALFVLSYYHPIVDETMTNMTLSDAKQANELLVQVLLQIACMVLNRV